VGSLTSYSNWIISIELSTTQAIRHMKQHGYDDKGNLILVGNKRRATRGIEDMYRDIKAAQERVIERDVC
jgi:hypothetical protein